MAELSVGADPEQLAIDAIDAAFEKLPEVSKVTATTKIPTDVKGATRAEFVRVWASNFNEETLVTQNPTLTVEGWANTETRAQRIMALAVAVLRVQEGDLFGVRVIGGVGNNPHPDYPSKARYSALLQVRTRSQILPLE